MEKLPLEFKKYFWDTDYNQLDLVKNRNFILGKLLLFGDLQAIIYILRNYNKSEIDNYLDKKGKHNLDRKSFGFWRELTRHDHLWKR